MADIAETAGIPPLVSPSSLHPQNGHPSIPDFPCKEFLIVISKNIILIEIRDTSTSVRLIPRLA
jgi:hypothetical protein